MRKRSLRETEAMLQSIKPKPNWKPFYFEGNQAWGVIDSPAKWRRILEAYKGATTADPYKAQRGLDGSIPKFGFYIEYTGPETLEQWAETNGMTDALAKAKGE